MHVLNLSLIFKTSIYLVKYIYNYIVIVIVFWSALVKITSVTGLTLKIFNKKNNRYLKFILILRKLQFLGWQILGRLRVLPPLSGGFSQLSPPATEGAAKNINK